MWRDILRYGAIAGLVVRRGDDDRGFWSAGGDMPHGAMGMVISYHAAG